jgi:hypothetical protein
MKTSPAKPPVSVAKPVAMPVPLRPLDELEIPPELSMATPATTGPIRPGCKLPPTASTDAIRCFLVEYDRSPGTFRIYQRECERLLLWSLVECRKPLSSLNRQDFEGYLNFLADPQPAACGAARRPSGHGEVAPFVGPLSESAVLTNGGDQFADALPGGCRLPAGQPWA